MTHKVNSTDSDNITINTFDSLHVGDLLVKERNYGMYIVLITAVCKYTVEASYCFISYGIYEDIDPYCEPRSYSKQSLFDWFNNIKCTTYQSYMA